MTKSKLSTFEAILIILSRLIPLTVISLPKTFLNELKSSAILNVIYLTILVILISLVISKLFKNFLGNDIIDISKFLGGTVFRNIIGSIFISYFLFSSAIILREFSESLNVVYYPYTDVKYIVLSFIFAIGVVNNFGFSSSIVKTTLLIFPPLILSIILLFLGNIDNFSFHRIFPILGDGFSNTFLLSLTNIGAFSGITYFYFIPSLLKEPKNFKKVTILSSILTGLIMIICVATLLLMFSIFISVDEIMPLFTSSRYIEFGTFFQRFESVFLLIWIVAFCCYLAISCLISTYIFGKMFNLKDSSQVFIIFIILLFVLTLLPKNYANAVHLETYYFRYFTIFIILLGLIILALANLKKKNTINKRR